MRYPASALLMVNSKGKKTKEPNSLATVLASCVPSRVLEASLFASRKATDLARLAWTRTVVCRNDASAGSAAAAPLAAARRASQTPSAPLGCVGAFREGEEGKGEGEGEDEEPLPLRVGEAQAAVGGGAVAVCLLREKERGGDR